MAEFIADSDMGPDVAYYYLGKHPTEASKIAPNVALSKKRLLEN
jgi:TRAP-type mannitol/chloroaromatic compound transport system substrate-binding protein